MERNGKRQKINSSLYRMSVVEWKKVNKLITNYIQGAMLVTVHSDGKAEMVTRVSDLDWRCKFCDLQLDLRLVYNDNE